MTLSSMLSLHIITPAQPIFVGQVSSVSLPTPDGEITVLPRHIPLVSIVSPGTILVRPTRKTELLFAVSRGVIQVDGKRVRILADTADRAEELEEKEVQAAKLRAQALLKERRGDVEGFAEATAILERELARLQVVRRRRRQRPLPGNV